MKRPLPSTITTPGAASILATVLLALLRSTPSYAKHDRVRCPTVLTAASMFDSDGSGGLDKSEFAKFIYGLDGVAITDAEASGNVSVSSLSESASDAYDHLLCQCHYAFGQDKLCCDDTSTDDEIVTDDDDDGGGGGGGGGDVLPVWGAEVSPIWREISLVALQGEENRQFAHVFCDEVLWVIDEGGMVMANITEVEVAAAAGSDATKPATTTATKPATTTATTTAAVEEDDTTAATTKATTSVGVTTATAATTATEAIKGDDTAAATTSAEETTATSAATDGTGTTSTDPFALSFLGSTGGEYAADYADFDDVMHAFWRLSLDLLRGNVERGLKKSGGMQRRQLRWDFGEEAAVYFESVITDVEDIDCPAGLPYAAEGSPCLIFLFQLFPLPDGPLDSSQSVDEFVRGFTDAANDDGRLYDALVEEYPGTIIVGLGDPGKGIPPSQSSASASALASASGGANQETQVVSLESSESAVKGSGFPAGGITGLVLASIVVSLAIAALVAKRSRRNSSRDLNDSNLSEDIEADEVNADAANVEEWLDEEDERAVGGEADSSAGTSALAAMGAASATATQLCTPAKAAVADDERRDRSTLVDGSAVATRLSTGDTEVMMVQQQAWSRVSPEV